MAKASKRASEAAKRSLVKRARYEATAKRGGKSKYAKKHGSNPRGNIGPNGMWERREVG